VVVRLSPESQGRRSLIPFSIKVFFHCLLVFLSYSPALSDIFHAPGLWHDMPVCAEGAVRHQSIN